MQRTKRMLVPVRKFGYPFEMMGRSSSLESSGKRPDFLSLNKLLRCNSLFREITKICKLAITLIGINGEIHDLDLVE